MTGPGTAAVNPRAFTARAVLVDIEGTTSTIAFVHSVLFPYADAHLDAYVAAHRNEPVVVRALADAAREAGVDVGAGDAVVLAHLHAWLAEDRKSTPLKTLQGLIWEEGFRKTGLRGHVYPDAAEGLRRWHAAGVALYVYSSGSIAAQKTLFGNSMEGDLSALFSGNFDTTTGPKRDPVAYARIARAINMAPRDVLFLSDVDAELDAARATGMQTLRVMRPADTPPGATTTHPRAQSFEGIAVTPPR